MSLNNKFTKFAVILSLAMTSFLSSHTLLADSSVWKAEKDGKHIYLGGTIHVLSKEDYPFPKEFDQAYKKSQIIYFETDIHGMKDPDVAKSMMSMLTTQQGDTINKALKPETIEALESFLKKRNLPLAMLDQFNISGLYIVLMSMELASMGMTNAGVDEH